MLMLIETGVANGGLAAEGRPELATICSISAFYTPIEERFERIVRLARRALQVPVAAVTTVSLESQWFKAVLGWNVGELPLRESLCEQTILRAERRIIHDLTKHPRYLAHQLVTKPPGFRFYAGCPLKSARGTVVGTFCVMDYRPRRLHRPERQILEDISGLARRELLAMVSHDAQTELTAKLSVASRQPLLDLLTKTWNRRGGDLLLDTGLELAKHNKSSLAVCAVAIDDLDFVNDRFGQSVGDRALRLVARELLACADHHDGVCRFEGNRFFVMFVGVEEQEVKRVSGVVTRRIQGTAIRVRDSGELRVSISSSISFAKYEIVTRAEQVLEEAVRALRENNKSGA